MRAVSPGARIVRLAALLLAMLGAIGFGQVAPASAATAPVTKADLCNAWIQAGAADPSVTLASGLTVSADQATRIGTSCKASGAGVKLTGAAVEQTSTGPASGSNAASQVLAAIMNAASSDPSLKEGDQLFKGAYLAGFNATLKLGYFEISGAVDLQFSGGTTSRFLFTGKLYGIDKFTMTLSSPAGGTTLPNITGSPVNFAGTLSLSGKTYTLDVTGSAASLVLGDGDQQVTATDASIALKLTSGDTPHVHATVAGTIGVGAAQAKGSVEADFDDTGLTAFTGTGALTLQIPAKGQIPAGTVTGSANFSYTRTPLARSVTFTGNATFGDAVVANAAGTIDDQSLTFTGNVSLTNSQLTLKGAVDGIAYFGDNLAGRTITSRDGSQVQATKGDVSLKSVSGSFTAKGLQISGSAQFGSVGSERWATGGGAVDLSFTQPGQSTTTVKGSATVSWIDGGDSSIAFSGSLATGDATVASVTGRVNGKKLTFDGQVSSPTISGKAKGTLYYASDLSGEAVINHAGAAVPATRGDVTLAVTDGRVQLGQVLATGALTLNKVGTQTWITTSAQLKVAQTWLAFSGELDVSGNFNLKGSGQVNFDGYQINFQGTAVSQNGVLAMTGGGSLRTSLFTVTLSGTIDKPDAASSAYVLTGAVNFKFGKYEVAGGKVRLTFGEGLTTAFSVKACVLFLCQNGTYKLYFAPGGTVNRAELSAPLTSVPLFLGIGSTVLGKNVKIATTITGII